MLITFKNRLSVPPYRIENQCKDVVVYFAQSSLVTQRDKWNWLLPSENQGGASMPYAWDEPNLDHALQVQVTC